MAMEPILDYSAATTKQVHNGRCRLVSVQVAGDGANGDCDLYDGQGTGGAQKLHLEVLSGTSHQWRAREPSLFHRGIYLVANATTTKVTIELIPLE